MRQKMDTLYVNPCFSMNAALRNTETELSSGRNRKRSGATSPKPTRAIPTSPSILPVRFQKLAVESGINSRHKQYLEAGMAGIKSAGVASGPPGIDPSHSSVGAAPMAAWMLVHCVHAISDPESYGGASRSTVFELIPFF